MTPAASLLRRRLGAIRVRLAVRRLIKGVSGSLLLAAGLYLALLLGSYWIPELMDAPLISIATMVFAGGLAITISIQVLSPPSRLEAARRADRLLGLEERLSTAAEFESADGERIVELAQRLDAERHAEAVQVSRVAPLRLPGVGWAALALLVASLAAQFLPPPTLPEITGGFGRAELERALDQVERLQTAVAREAERREDPYLGAVAGALEMFRRDLASGGLDRQESRRQLTQIIEHMMRASDLEGNPAALAEQLLASSPSELPAAAAAGDAPTRGGDGAQPQVEGDLPPFAGLDPLLDAANRPLEGGLENERAPSPRAVGGAIPIANSLRPCRSRPCALRKRPERPTGLSSVRWQIPIRVRVASPAKVRRSSSATPLLKATRCLRLRRSGPARRDRKRRASRRASNSHPTWNW